MNKLHEECGVFGIVSPETCDVARSTYYGLFALQHRGQESCGIVVNDNGLFSCYKDNGIVNDVFTTEVIESLGLGNMAIGHVRYGTSKNKDRLNAQPLLVNHIKGRMSLSLNGTLVNAPQLREELELEGAIFQTTSDTELISYLITKERLKSESIEEAISCAVNRLEGAFSLIVMSPSKMIAVRDKYGFKPLCFGQAHDGSYVIASESCALDAVEARVIREIEPGEIIIFDKLGVRSITDHCKQCDPAICIFEYIYFARPDSVIENCSVHKARVRAGIFLALEEPIPADIVIGVPDSGLDAAIGYSRQSGIPYGIGFIKNKYIGRTFIAPGQKSRENLVKIKLNPVSDTVRGKRVVLVDDSIVRGTTCKKIVKLLREAGAKEVHMRVSSPPFINLCYYGTDIDSKENLIACNYTKNEIAEIIGVDSLGYLSRDVLGRLVDKEDNKGFCEACFSGNYPTEEPLEIKKRKYDYKIGEAR